MRSLSELLARDPPAGVGRPEAAQVEKLLEIYYRHIDPADLEGMDQQDMLGALVAHWRLMQHRPAAQALVRVYNPDQEEHGWRSPDSIVEIVAPDTPFLVDSVSAALNARHLAIHLTIHPVFLVERDARGRLRRVAESLVAAEGCCAEALIQMHIDRQSGEDLSGLEQEVAAVIDDVRAVTGDWAAMRGVAAQAAASLLEGQQGGADQDGQEARAFIEWMLDDHFLFIATCRLDPALDRTGGMALRRVDESGLGALRPDPRRHNLGDRAGLWLAGLDMDLSKSREAVVVTKANARSRVHRPAYMDCVLVSSHDATGRVAGVNCLIGLFSSAAYTTPPGQIPLLRRKLQRVFAGARVAPRSHSGRVIVNILDNFPRDTLFHIGTDALLETTLGILSLQDRQRTRLFVMPEPFGRFVSCLVFLPRERYGREVRLAIQQILVEALGGCDVVFETQFSESILARVHFVVRIPPGVAPEYDPVDLERRVAEAATSWQDGLRQALIVQTDEVIAARFVRDYAQAFPGGYREDVHPRIAVDDIQRIELARAEGRLILHLYHPLTDADVQLNVRLYAVGSPLSLSRVIPILEQMGLRVFGERPYRIRHPQGDVWIHDFATHRAGPAVPVSEALKLAFVDGFRRVWDGDLDSDAFNGLILGAGLSWQQALLLRAYSRYLQQIKAPHTQAYVATVLGRYPAAVQALLQIFESAFAPCSGDEGVDDGALLQAFESALERVGTLDEDRVLRSLLNLIQATLRANFHAIDGQTGGRPYIALKIDPSRVSGMPQPAPMFEIFVYAVHMEGVHLRGGKVARGGLRWSDRMEDYRTEVLGLMKAQMVKNAVIVPVGSKGGFVAKEVTPEDGRERRAEKGLAAYRTLLRGMLDLTDNRQGGAVVVPPGIRRRDGDDPYLVVAADKGTASFSDIANQVAAEYGFWLGDAFASGGSAGYDHKAMGITARGAWESVKRNFRELGVDTRNTPFSVIGIGDMSGDVFGNGTLLSSRIRLLGAFDHRHIFIDPDPDPVRSHAERQRLFQMPRSAWSDYDARLISAGGGVYPRSAKRIALSPEARKSLGIDSERLSPNELIRALLRAPVDLLWNGGIGTYVKAAAESHEQVSDKANDALRVDAGELRCRVVGEGGNLGFTQLARVEYALRGGQIYTDAIDNSGGVDCSDHEVNIKILLNTLVAEGDLTLKQRNQLLADMQDEVARLVLANNYAQTQAISIVHAAGVRRLNEQARFMDLLEQKGGFHRRLEGLPDRKMINERMAAGQGLTKPEIAVLIAYSKMNYFDALVSSDVPDDPFVHGHLLGYFPRRLAERFGDAIGAHRLRREIIASMVASAVVDHIGPGVGFRVREELGCDIASIARAYLVVGEVFAVDRLWRDVEALDYLVPARLQIEMFAEVAVFFEQSLTALLRRHKGSEDMRLLCDRLQPGVRELAEVMPRPLIGSARTEVGRHSRRLMRQGVPRELAASLAVLPYMAAAIDIVEISQRCSTPVALAAGIHSALGHVLELDWISSQIDELAVQTHWHQLARTKLQAALRSHQRGLAVQVLRGAGHERSSRAIIGLWTERQASQLARHAHTLAEFKAGQVFDFAILSLIVAGVGDLLGSPPDLGENGTV